LKISKPERIIFLGEAALGKTSHQKSFLTSITKK